MTSCNEIQIIDLTNESSDSEADEVVDITDQEIARQRLMDQDNSKNLSNKGRELFRKGQYHPALNAYNSALNLCGGRPSDWYYRSKVHHELKSYTEAIADAKFAIQLNPRIYKYYDWLLKLRLEIGQGFKCLRIIKLMKESFPLETQKPPFTIMEKNVIRLNDLLGHIKNKDSENHEKSLEDISAALKIAPASLFLLLAQIEILIKIKDYIQARRAIVLVFDQDPENAMGMYYRSRAFYQLCEFHDALRTAKELSRRDPTNKEYDSFLKGMTAVTQEFTRANVFKSQRNFSEAKRSYNNIIFMLTKKLEGMCYFELAQIEFGLDNQFDSLELCNKAIHSDKECVDAMILKADIYIKQNILEDAVKELNSAQEIHYRANVSCKLNQLFELMNHYTVLGLESSASSGSIKKAYKKALLEYHPDKNSEATSLELDINKKKLENVLKAYNILSDEEKRKAYDQEMNKNGKSYDGTYMSGPYSQF